MSSRRRRQNHSGGFLLDNAAGRNSIGSAGQSSSQGRFSFESTSQPSSSDHRVPSVKDSASLRNEAGPVFTSSPISSFSLKGKEREGSASPAWHDENTTNPAFASDPSQIVNLALSLSEERKKLFANKRLSSLNPSRSVRVSSGGSRNENVFLPSPQGQTFPTKDELSLPSVQSALPTTLSAGTVGRVTKAKRELELRSEYLRLLDIVPESFGVEHSRVNAVRNRASRLGVKKSAVISHPAWNNVQTVQTWVNEVKRATEVWNIDGSYAPDVPKFDSLADETVLEANLEDVTTTKSKQKVRGRPTKLMWSIDPAELLADLYIQLKTQPMTRNNETGVQEPNGVAVPDVDDDDLIETMSNTVSDRGSWNPNPNRQLSTRSASTKAQDYGLSRTTSWSSSDSDRYRKRDILKRSATFLKSKVQTPITSSARQDKQSKTTTSATNLKTPPRALVGPPSDIDFQRSPEDQDNQVEHSRTPPNGALANGRKSFESSLGDSPRIPTAISIQNVDSDLNLPSFMIEPRSREKPTLPRVLTTTLSRQGTRPTTPLDTSVAGDSSKRNDDLLSPESAARPPPLRKSSSVSAFGNMSDREDGYTSAGRDNRKRSFLTRPATKLGDLITRREAMRKHPKEYLQSGTASEVSDGEDIDPKAAPRRRPLSRRSTTENVTRVQAGKLRTADLPKENKYFLRNLPAFKSSLDYELVTPLNASVANGVWGDTKSVQSSTDLTQQPVIEDVPAEEEAAQEEQALKPRQVIVEMTRKFQESHDPDAIFDPAMIYLTATGTSELDRPTQAKVLFTWYEVRNSTLQSTNESLYRYLNDEPDTASAIGKHKPFSSNLQLLDRAQKEQLDLEDTYRKFSQHTVAGLEDRIRKCTVEIRSDLSPKCGQSTDAADALTAKLSTEYTLALKEISDRMEALIRRRRQRFRWVRRGGFAMLEWVLRALMWVVWLVVVILRIFRGTIRTGWRVAKWALWIPG